MPTESTDEQDLADLERASAGDRPAFARVVLRHQATILRLSRALTSSEALAEEVLQETFVAAFRHAGGFRADSSVRTWLMAIARNAASKAQRKRAGEPKEHVPLDELGVAAGWGQDPETQVADAEQRQALKRALSTLSKSDRTVIVLRDLDGLSNAEAAEVLDLSVNTLKTRLHRARLRLMAEVKKGGTRHGS